MGCTIHYFCLMLVMYKFTAFHIIIIDFRFCRVIDKTCTNPTQYLEQGMMWDDIAILARYLLMLSWNNCLDVAIHLPYLFHG